MLENELLKLKNLLNKLIESVSQKVDSLSSLTGRDLIKNEKILIDMVKKLVGLTMDINKSLAGKNDTIFFSEEDEKIIDQFYKNYRIKIENDRK